MRVNEEGERIPLTIADSDSEKGTVSIIFQIVGKTTMLLNTLEEGDSLHDFVGPLGKPSEIDGNEKYVSSVVVLDVPLRIQLQKLSMKLVQM